MSNVWSELSENSYLVTHEVGPNQQGMRLDAFLKDRYSKRSREQIKRAIDSGAITVKRGQGLTVGRLKPSSQLIPGDQVLVLSEKKPEPEVSFDYKILFEDEHLFVVDKPPNLPVHPAGKYFFNTLQTHLKNQGRDYYLVHRIDKETSGILVMTKTLEACTRLTQQFADRTTEKRYFAVTHGITPEDFSVDKALMRSTNSKIELKMTTGLESEGAQTAFTGFKRLETAGNFSLVECFPKTGRQHQIRVHLDSVGHPLVGDKLYGLPELEAEPFFNRDGSIRQEILDKLILPRHALHAAGIRFDHPITGERVEVRCGLPRDLRDFLDSHT